MAYIYILATPLGFVMDWLTSVLGSLQGGSAVVLGLVIGVMTAFDMGGPINKTASTFTMAIMASGIYGPNGMFRVAVAVPRSPVASLRSSPRISSMTPIVRWVSPHCSWAASALPRALSPSRSRTLATPCPASASALPWARRSPPSRYRLLRPARWLYRRPCHQQRRAVLPGHRDWLRGRRCNPDCHEAHAR